MGIPQQQSTAMTITTMIQVAKPTATLPIPLARSPRPLRILTQASNSSWVQLFCTFCSSQDRPAPPSDFASPSAWAVAMARNSMGSRSRVSLHEIIVVIYLTYTDDVQEVTPH